MSEWINKIHQGNSLEVLRKMPLNLVDCAVTSPPYYNLRTYNSNAEFDDGWKGELGHEPTVDLYVKHLCDIFDEVKRVLKPWGTCWVNISDSYGTISGGMNQMAKTGEGSSYGQIPYDAEGYGVNQDTKETRHKCLLQVPERFAIEMTNRGWILRNTLIWKKNSGMPESCKDRFTRNWEYIFFFVKSNNPLFWTNNKTCHMVSKKPDGINGIEEQDWEWSEGAVQEKLEIGLSDCRCNAGWGRGIVMDVFMGSGTSAVVAKKMGRDYIGIEINPEYVEMSKKEIDKVPMDLDRFEDNKVERVGV